MTVEKMTCGHCEQTVEPLPGTATVTEVTADRSGRQSTPYVDLS